jgi:hypothetical protein
MGLSGMFLCIVLVSLSCATRTDWSAAEAVVTNAIASGAFPGAVAAVGNAQGLLFSAALGKFTFGIPPPRDPGLSGSVTFVFLCLSCLCIVGVPSMTLDTRFDMASCSKVMATTTAAAFLYQRGLLDIHAPATNILGAAYGNHGKAAVQIVHLLTHSAGYPGDPSPGYWEVPFGCPQSPHFHPAQDFSCTELIYRGLLNQTLINTPGAVYLYSDLSFITLQYVVGTIVVMFVCVTICVV